MKPQRMEFTFNPWAQIINVRTSRRFRQYHFASRRRYWRFCFALMDRLLARGWHFCQEAGCVYLSAQKREWNLCECGAVLELPESLASKRCTQCRTEAQ